MNPAAGDLLPGSLAGSVAGAGWAWMLALLVGACLPVLRDDDADGRPRDPAGFLLRAAVAGMPLVTTAWLALGLFGALTPSVVLAVAGALTLLGLALSGRRVARSVGALARGARNAGRPRTLLALASATMLAVFLLLVTAMAMSPSIYYDDLSYHLGLPRQALLLGAWPALPTFHYSYLPAGWDAAYVLPFSLGGGTGPQLMNAVGLALLACVTFRLARRGGAARAALVATTLALVAPVFGMSGAWAGNDLFVVLALAVALDHLLATQGARPWTTGLLAGAAWAAKYTALPATGGLALAAVLVSSGSVPRRVLRGAVLLATTLAVALPWTLHAWHLTGNPIYPSFLGGRYWDQASRELVASIERTGFDGPHALLFAARDLLLRSRDLGYPSGLDPAYLVMAVLGFLAWRRVKDARAFACVALLTYVGWCVTFLNLRYALVLLVVLAPFAAAMVDVVRERLVPFAPRAVDALAAILVLAIVGGPFAELAGLHVSAYGGRSPLFEARSHVLDARIQAAKAGAALAGELPDDARIFVLAEGRLALVPRVASVSSGYDQQAIAPYLAGTRDPSEVTARLRADGYTHVLVNHRELLRWRATLRFDERLGPGGAGVLTGWLASMPEAGRWGDVVVHRLE